MPQKQLFATDCDGKWLPEECTACRLRIEQEAEAEFKELFEDDPGFEKFLLEMDRWLGITQ